MYTVSVADIAEVQDRRVEWNALVRQMAFPSIFCTWEWIYTWWEHFGTRYEPVILFIRREGELAGILPLALRKSSGGGWLAGRALTFCGADELYTDHLDLISAPEDAVLCLEAVLHFLSDDFTDWTALNLPALAEDSRIASRLAADTAPFAWEAQPTSAARFISLEGEFDSYRSSLSKKRRNTLTSSRKKLVEQHGMRYVACAPADFSAGLDRVFRLHNLRASRTGIVSTFSRPEIVAYHNDLVRRLEPSVVWLRWLDCDGATIAAEYDFAFEGCVFHYQKGFDPAWGRFSPAVILELETIREAFEAGCHEYNFLRGGEEYKDSLARQGRALFHGCLYNSTLRAGLAKASTRSARSVRRYLKLLVGQATTPDRPAPTTGTREI